MKELVAQGAQAFSEKRFADAAQLFEQAHEAKANPTLLKNAMVAWYKGNECDKAVHVGARYYREATDSGQLEAKDQSEIQTVISCSLNLAQQRIDEGLFTQAEDLLFTATSAGPTDEQNRRIASLRDELRAKRDASAEGGGGSGGGGSEGGGTTEPDSESLSPIAITGWAMTGVGVAGLVGSVIYAVTAESDLRDAVTACEVRITEGTAAYHSCIDERIGSNIVQDQNYKEVVEDPINSAQVTSAILYGVSGAVTGIGVAILVYHYFFASAEESAPPVVIAPMLGEDTAGAELIWRF